MTLVPVGMCARRAWCSFLKILKKGEALKKEVPVGAVLIIINTVLVSYFSSVYNGLDMN